MPLPLLRLLLLFAAALLPRARGQHVIPLDEARCSACAAVAWELEAALRREKPGQGDMDLRGHLDRLTGDGRGKVTEWRMSELRAMQIMEGLCPHMEDYALVREDGEVFYQKVKNVAGGFTITGRINLHGEDADRVALRLYCDTIIEAHEDDITSMIRDGSVDIHLLSQALCVDELQVCTEDDLDSIPVPVLPTAKPTTKPPSSGGGSSSSTKTDDDQKRDAMEALPEGLAGALGSLKQRLKQRQEQKDAMGDSWQWDGSEEEEEDDDEEGGEELEGETHAPPGSPPPGAQKKKRKVRHSNLNREPPLYTTANEQGFPKGAQKGSATWEKYFGDPFKPKEPEQPASSTAKGKRRKRKQRDGPTGVRPKGHPAWEKYFGAPTNKAAKSGSDEL